MQYDGPWILVMKYELKQVKVLHFVLAVLSCVSTFLLTSRSYNGVVPATCVISGFRCCVNEIFVLILKCAIPDVCLNYMVR